MTACTVSALRRPLRDIDLTLDINTELFPVVSGDNVHTLIARAISLDNDGGKDWRDVSRGENLPEDH
jgi:RNA polymerase Rpb8